VHQKMPGFVGSRRWTSCRSMNAKMKRSFPNGRTFGVQL
jgi:hypothetical protein